MAIQLTVENGTDVANANTFVLIADVQAFATSRGVSNDVVAAGGDGLAVFILQACDWLQTQENNMLGVRTNADQKLCYPRASVPLPSSLATDGSVQENVLDDATIPDALKNGQSMLACLLAGGLVLYDNNNDPFVVNEKVDVIETRYSEKIVGAGVADMPQVMAYLRPLLSSQGIGYLNVVRV